MFAAECTTPLRTTPGTVTPTGPVASGNRLTSSAITSATASGVEGCGVSMRCRSVAKSPTMRSTGAALMPLPPKSMPIGLVMASVFQSRRPTGAYDVPDSDAGTSTR
jgi:hypothetical protein